MVQPNCTSDLDTETTLGGNLLAVLVIIPHVPPPCPDSDICMVDAKVALIREDNVSPLPPGPVLVMLQAKKLLLSVPGCLDHSHSWEKVTQVSLPQTTYSLARNGPVMAPNGHPGCFSGRTEAIMAILD